MVAGAYNPAALEAEAGESLKPGEAEFAVSQDCAIALQPGQQEQNSVSKKKEVKMINFTPYILQQYLKISTVICQKTVNYAPEIGELYGV